MPLELAFEAEPDLPVSRNRYHMDTIEGAAVAQLLDLDTGRLDAGAPVRRKRR
jgi:hypothetical protein